MMAKAKSTLEALIVNDPEHPAIRKFIVCIEIVLALPPGDDTTKIEAIGHLLEKLRKNLQY